MPLVRIDAAGDDPARLDQLGDAVHSALVEAFGIPADDRFQVLTTHGAALVYDPYYLGVERDDPVFVQVFLREGRTPELKRSFYQALAERAPLAGVDPRNLVVVLVENTVADWSFGNGEAQYLDAPPAPAT